MNICNDVIRFFFGWGGRRTLGLNSMLAWTSWKTFAQSRFWYNSDWRWSLGLNNLFRFVSFLFPILHCCQTLTGWRNKNLGFYTTALWKSNANVIWRISFFVPVNFRVKIRVKFRKISCETFHYQTIFRAKFQGNIVRYFRRANKKSPKRNFGAPINKLMSNEMKQQIIYGNVTEMQG